MFSGIVECVGEILDAVPREGVVRISISPSIKMSGAPMKIGESVSVNGVCLTLEKETIPWVFALGKETLEVTGWNPRILVGKKVNLERALAFGERVNGHLVSGHVETMGTVSEVKDVGENRALTIIFPDKFGQLVWPKGWIAINGVSLTINQVAKNSLSVGLIPETLKRTNLAYLKPGDLVCLEFDSFAKGLMHWLDSGGDSIAQHYR